MEHQLENLLRQEELLLATIPLQMQKNKKIPQKDTLINTGINMIATGDQNLNPNTPSFQPHSHPPPSQPAYQAPNPRGGPPIIPPPYQAPKYTPTNPQRGALNNPHPYQTPNYTPPNTQGQPSNNPPRRISFPVKCVIKKSIQPSSVIRLNLRFP